MKLITVILTALICCIPFGYAAEGVSSEAQQLEKIKHDYRIPGFSVVVTRGGNRLPHDYLLKHFSGTTASNTPSSITESTYFPIASLTKVFSSYAALNLANKGKLDLGAPLSAFFPDDGLPADLQIKDLLSHTLVGKGERAFFYDPRFYLLTKIIADAGGKPFDEILLSEAGKGLPPSGVLPYQPKHVDPLTNTHALAVGHRFEGENIEIPHDMGLSAAAGLMATPRAITDFGVHLMRTSLKREGKYHNFDGYTQSQRYSNGFFRQHIAGHGTYWSYGQYDGYAAFWMLVPEQELQIVALSNNNILSDASRLIFGDATASPIAHFFVKNYLCNQKACDVSAMERNAQIHKSVYFSRYEKAEYVAAISRIDNWLTTPEKWPLQGNLNLLHLSSYLFTVSRHLEYEKPAWREGEQQLVEYLLTSESNITPYLYYYAGAFYDRMGDIDRAKSNFNALKNLRNMPSHWTLSEANAWLANN